MLKYILLGFLNYDTMTGYNLKTVLDSSVLCFWHAYHSQIYTVLRHLEKDGLVSSQVVDDNEDKLHRRYYTITDSGRTEFMQWLNEPLTSTSPVKEALLVRMFFSAQRDKSAVIKELQFQRQLHLQKLLSYQNLTPENLQEKIEAHPHLTPEVQFWMSTLQFGIDFEQMYINWLDKIIAQLEST